MSALRCRSLALLLLFLNLAACTTWRLSTVRPSELVEDERPSAIRVVQSDGAAVVIRSPRIEGDSILGTEQECVRLLSGRQPQYSCAWVDGPRVSLDDIERVEVERSVGVVPTLIIGLPILAGVGLLLAGLPWCVC